MNDCEVGEYWNSNADTWTRLARAGYDVYRDHLNTPAFLAMLPDVSGLVGLDIGCGEGANTRAVAARGAAMTAVDIAEVFVRHAVDLERQSPLGIDYRVASGQSLPFPDRSFDFATAFMSLMDLPEPDRALAEAFRVLRPGGFLQFSISHPCFSPPYRRNIRSGGRTVAVEVGDYFRPQSGEIEEWIFTSAPRELTAGLPRFRVPRFHRPLSEWVNLVTDAGFRVERLAEPKPSDEVVRACPALQDAQVVAYFLHVRGRKPGGQ